MDIHPDLQGLSVNEIDHRLRFDALTAGVKPGGLRSVTTIQMLVCYLIANINGKVSAENIIQTMDESMLANHFEIANAIDQLKKKAVIGEHEDGALYLIKPTKEDIDIIEHDLPYTVRTQSMELCQKIIAKEQFKRENKVTITQEGNHYQVLLHVSDGDTDFLTLRLFAPTIDQAELIKEKFITNPVAVYDKLIEFIFDNKE